MVDQLNRQLTIGNTVSGQRPLSTAVHSPVDSLVRAVVTCLKPFESSSPKIHIKEWKKANSLQLVLGKCLLVNKAGRYALVLC